MLLSSTSNTFHLINKISCLYLVVSDLSLCLWNETSPHPRQLRGLSRGERGRARENAMEEKKCKISPYTLPSVPFFSLAVLTVVPSGCLPSFRGGIRSFIRSRPRASSKLRIFRVGEKPWMANREKKRNQGKLGG